MFEKRAPQTEDPSKNTLYGVLGVPPTASDSEIKAAYRKLAFDTHPDRGGDSELFKTITKAYETLGSKDRRQAYNESIAPKEAPKPPSPTAEDMAKWAAKREQTQRMRVADAAIREETVQNIRERLRQQPSATQASQPPIKTGQQAFYDTLPPNVRANAVSTDTFIQGLTKKPGNPVTARPGTPERFDQVVKNIINKPIEKAP